MFSQGRVVRFDVDQLGIRTEAGAGIGDTESRIKELYRGHILIEPHHYDDNGHYLHYAAGNRDHGFGIIFETDGTRVTSFRAGTEAAISLVEGCS